MDAGLHHIFRAKKIILCEVVRKVVHGMHLGQTVLRELRAGTTFFDCLSSAESQQSA
jgi:hypothetical protein